MKLHLHLLASALLVSTVACADGEVGSSSEEMVGREMVVEFGVENESAPMLENGATDKDVAVANAALPNGYYECYFNGFYGLQNSSIISLDILSVSKYSSMDEEGNYHFDEASEEIHFLSGSLESRTAHLEESSGKPAIVFIRDENEVNGEPTIDISDTWCYFEPDA